MSHDAHHFYGRRKGKPLHKGRATSLDAVRDRCLIPPVAQELDMLDPAALFDKNFEKIAMEIGFGGGEHLINQTLLHPDTGFIGCEPFINGLAAAAKEIIEQDLHNIRLYPDDAMHLLTRFPDASLDCVFLLFPDPWPKTRHHKRRFIQPHTVALLARVLRSGGRLVLATDDRNLADWMLLYTVNHKDFVWDRASDGSWSAPPRDWVETRYQQKAAQQGRLAYFITFTRL
jgi:tRNA (guanine-N7-)-methyltransferase